MKVCVITDNQFIYESFLELLTDAAYQKAQFDFYYSSWNQAFAARYGAEGPFRPVNLKKAGSDFFESYDLFLSLHCKQIFPAELVKSRRCINVHPGFNPCNRGWYPQVFSILNQKPVGVTIHEIDEELDHGPIIVQEQVPVYAWDTSYDVYQRIQQLEIRLLKEHLPTLLSGSYQAFMPESEGNLNLEKDFQALCRLNLDETVTWREAIDRLRALSFHGYRNAYFYDEEGHRIDVEIQLEKREESL